ncbi:MAG: phosphoribosylamine--glycine ligase [Promethearchaeota archaeon]|nr:MAG: phosphoribosylamine--glycine ligase [Candidatus Lokiarchaeota archaeon]
MNVLVVGHGAREHVIGEALVRGGAKLYAYMSFKNAGLDELSDHRVKIDDETNFKYIIEYCKEKHIDFVVVGPEKPLCVGIVDALESNGFPCVGPKIEAAQIEGSKVFMRNLLDKYKIHSNVKGKVFRSMDGVEEYIDREGEENLVVKPEGLTGGKGVKVFGDHLHSKKEMLDYCESLASQRRRFLLEEKMEGEEFTLQTFVDGKTVLGSPLVQDHKRAYEGDEGPNTGGMGSYSMANHLLPFITKEDVDQALKDMRDVIRAIKAETGVEYKGFLYGQFMKTASGNKLIEFNARLGDPEAMNILPILQTNFVEICQAIINGYLDKLQIDYEKKATVCKYLAPEGYPKSPKDNQPININQERLKKIGAKYYYASADKRDDKIFTTTSRAMGILGIAESLEKAEQIAERGVGCIEGNLFHRKDVGTLALLQKRIDHIDSLLNK